MWKDRGLVFCNEFGDYLSTTMRNRNFHAILEHAGRPRVRFYDLRHRAATRMLKASINPKSVSKTLGHASVATHEVPRSTQQPGPSGSETTLRQGCRAP